MNNLWVLGENHPDWLMPPDDSEQDTDSEDDDEESAWDDLPPTPLDPPDESDPGADSGADAGEEDDAFPGRFHFPDEGNVFGPHIGRPGHFLGPNRFGGPRFEARPGGISPVSPASRAVDQVFGRDSGGFLTNHSDRPSRQFGGTTFGSRGFPRRL